MTTLMTEETKFEESVRFGEQFRLYEAIAQAGPVTSDELAAIARVPRSQISHWLRVQEACQTVTRSRAPERYQTWCDIPRN
jgi:hypothetical protein